MNKSDKSQALAFKRQCRQAAKELGCKPTDEAAIQMTMYQLQRSALQARLAAGQVVNTAELVQLNEVIKAIQPAAGPLKVEIVFVNGSLTACPSCDIEFEPPETGDATCPQCKHVFSPESPATTRERKRAAAKAASPKPDGNSSPGGSVGSSDIVNKPEVVKASGPAPAARPAPPPPPPLPRNPSMAAWERAHGRVYGRSSKDGGPIHGSPAFDPTSKYNQGYNNDLPVMWSGYQDGTGQYGTAASPDPNPNFNSDGSPRSGHPLPYPTPTNGGKS